MPETTQDQTFLPSHSYKIDLMIGELNYGLDLLEITIVSSIKTPYQTVLLTLNLDPSDIVLEKIYGQTPLNLNIQLLAQTTTPYENIRMELVYLDSNFQIPMKTANQSVQRERVPIQIVTVCRKPFQTMTRMINKVYLAKKLKEIISGMITGTNAELNYDTQGENHSVIDQVLLPPTTIYKNILYLDHSFGLFNGASGIFCDYQNRLFIKNLSKKINSSPIFKIIQFTQDLDQREIIEGSFDGETFYTMHNVKNSYTGNSVFSALAPKMNFIIKPDDSLASVVELTLKDFCEIYGIIDRNDEIHFDERGGLNRVSYIDHSGYRDSGSFAVAEIAKRIIDLSTLEVMLEGSLFLEKLMQVGECVKFIAGGSDVVGLGGKYVLKASEIVLRKGRGWGAGVRVYLMRTNKSSI